MNDRPEDLPPAPPRASLRGVFERLLPHAEAGADEEATCFDGSEAGWAEGEAEAGTLLRRALPEVYFVNTPAARVARHAEMLGRLRAGGRGPLIDFHAAPGLPLIECTLCAFDDDKPGLLARLCGTMAALNLSIHTAFLYTLSLERLGIEASRGESACASGNGKMVALDTFLLSESYFGHDRALTPRTQKKLKAELCRALRDPSRVPPLLSRPLRSFAPLQRCEIALENRAHEEHTRVVLRAEDSSGVLYRAARAMSEANLDVRTALISTRDEGADDLFFVAAPGGGKLPEDDLPRVGAELRARLQGEA